MSRAEHSCHDSRILCEHFVIDHRLHYILNRRNVSFSSRFFRRVILIGLQCEWLLHHHSTNLFTQCLALTQWFLRLTQEKDLSDLMCAIPHEFMIDTWQWRRLCCLLIISFSSSHWHQHGNGAKIPLFLWLLHSEIVNYPLWF